MSIEKHVDKASRPRVKVSIIKCGGDGRKDAYKYLSRLIVDRIKKT